MEELITFLIIIFFVYILIECIKFDNQNKKS